MLPIKSLKGGLVDASFVDSGEIRFIIYVRCQWSDGSLADPTPD